jgi:protein-S-isoprenylcysteine O-methyltransferase Ste14
LPRDGNTSALETGFGAARPGDRRGRKSLLVRYGDFLFKYRNFLFPVVTALLLFGFRPVYPGGNAGLDLWFDALGIGLVLAGQVVRTAVIGLIYIKRGGVNKRVFAENLVTEGMFGHCRNPLYVGNFLMLVGFFVIHNNPWVYVLGGGFFVLSYRAIVAAEEYFLIGRFGQAYEAYCERVSRWWIDPEGLRDTLRGMTFNWRRVVIKDYSTILTWSTTVLMLLAYQAVVRDGLDASKGVLAVSGASILAVAAAASFIRLLKKSGRLTA